jgi:cell division protein FtsB
MTRDFDRKEKESETYLQEQEATRTLKAENAELKEKVEKLEAKVKYLRRKLTLLKDYYVK